MPAHADALLAAVHLVLQRARHHAIVEDDLVERGAVVAQHARHRIALARQARRQVGGRRAVERMLSDLLPALEDLRRVGLQDRARGARGRGAQHDAAIEQRRHVGGQPLALRLALDAAREGDARAQRMIDKVAAGHGEIHRLTRTLVGTLGLGAHLDHHRRAGRRPVFQAGAIG